MGITITSGAEGSGGLPLLSPILLTSLFLFSRLVFWKMGVRFMSDEVSHFGHYLDVDLLQHRLWTSLWYLHSQPPLMNLLYGLLLRLFPAHWAAAAYCLLLLMGLAAYLAIYFLAIRNGVNPIFALTLVSIAVCDPSAAVFEAEPMYTHLCFCLLVFAAFFLDSYLRNPQTVSAASFLGTLAVLALTRASYHLLWYVAIACMLVRWSPSRQRKVVIAMALCFAAIIGTVYVKNGLLFGSYSPSSWTGISLAKSWAWRHPFPEIAQMIKSGKLSPVSTIPPFSAAERYEIVLGVPSRTGVESLDALRKRNGDQNLNNLVYLAASRAYMKDYWVVWKNAPSVIVRMWPQSWGDYFRPASAYIAQFDPANQTAVEPVDLWYRVIFCCGQTSLTADSSVLLNEAWWERPLRLFADSCWPELAAGSSRFSFSYVIPRETG